MLYLNGQFVNRQDATISALDRGVLFGDGIYEVIPVYSRKPFRLDEHLHRLDASLAAIGLPNPHSIEQWAALVLETIARQDFDDQSVYLHVTRGNAGERDFPFPADVAPTVMINSSRLVTPTPAQKAAGVKAISHGDFRWLRCDIKSLNLLPTVLLREAAKRAGCAEAVMFRDSWAFGLEAASNGAAQSAPQRYLSEGAASNIFVVKDGVLLAPPKSQLMLPGITYDLVIEIAEANQVPLEIRPISEAEVRSADELWMTSSTKEVLSIVMLDGEPVGDGKVGPMAQQLDTLYQAFKQQVMRGGD
ncbi:D-amino acid aminotransferase [Chitinimonas sp.]|uniref:D-amino acid aminotransferase n=1 Tax=Chitinimonas sp. TaxID=1934313 RepID=UPI0035B2833F